MEEKKKVKLTSKSQDYAQWYLDVSKAGELFDYSPTPGCIFFKPKAVALWETMKRNLDRDFASLGVRNVLLPLLIPMSFFEREKEHVEGFSPELAVVTHGGGKELEEKLAVRPTSETMFCEYFRNELNSYRDLPILTNQWVNVMRWEKRTRPFLRTTEFYWQEGHTLHESEPEADGFAQKIMFEVYAKNLRENGAIFGVSGMKSESEKFAGGIRTYTYEPMMSNGWALQICTSHLLSKGFMKQFDVSYLGREGKAEHPSYTSWGMSTRTIGGLISSHSDDKGLVIPPRMSEYRAVLIPIYGSERTDDEIDAFAARVAREILGESWIIPVNGEYRKAFVNGSGEKVLIDYRKLRLGEKMTDFELSGYPLAIVFGGRDIQGPSEGKIELRSRISEEKRTFAVPSAGLSETIREIAESDQQILFDRSRNRLEENIEICVDLEQVGAAIERSKFALYEWDTSDNFVGSRLEAEIKERFKATTRCIPFEGQLKVIDDFRLTRENTVKVLIARAF